MHISDIRLLRCDEAPLWLYHPGPEWMANNRLKLVADKMQVIWLEAHQQLNKFTADMLTLPNITVQFAEVVNDLGVNYVSSG